MEKTKLGLSQNIEAVLCYSLPPIAFLSGLIMLILEPDNKFVRFHAMQSFILFGAFGIAAVILRLIPFLGGSLSSILGIAMLVSWIICVLKAYRGKFYKVPYIGETVYEKVVG